MQRASLPSSWSVRSPGGAPRRRAVSAIVCLAGLAVLGSCNDYPVHSLLENLRVRVTDKLSADDPVKLDFLWVIDHSPSMCQEQRDLAKGFNQFITRLQSLGSIDARMAVVTVQQTPDKTDVRVVGRFKHEPAKAFPPNCMERVRMHCSTNSHCAATPHSFQFPVATDSSLCEPVTQSVSLPFTTGTWACKTSTADVKTLTNQNCSINSTCEAKCKDITNHKDCRALFEPNVPADQQRIRCVVPGGGTSTDQAGCMYPPDTDKCPPPDQIPAVLDSKQLGLFNCIATVGAAQTQESSFEGGFRSAWVALDPKGPNCDYGACVQHLRTCCVDGGEWCKTDKNDAKCAKDTAEMCEPLKNPANCQAKQLLRDDAYLVIVFVSDDDDCSMPLHLNPLDKGTITKEVWQRCQVFGDELAGNVALNEGNCEFRRGKNADQFCPSDCLAGSKTKDVGGKLKCPNGCPDGGPEQAACLAKVDAAYKGFEKRTNQFAAVGEFVNRFKGIKNDPARVIVASIVGDTVTTKGALQEHRDRVTFYASAFKDIAPGQTPYVCQGSRGEAGYGSRYVQLAEAFRDNGVVQNICKGSDFGPALENIATTILRRVIKLCLPQPPTLDKDGKRLIAVTRTRGNKAEALTLSDGPVAGDDTTYYIAPSPDCRAGKSEIKGQLAPCVATRDCNAGLTCIEGLCQVYNEAIFFSEVPQPTDVIEINYPADLGLR